MLSDLVALVAGRPDNRDTDDSGLTQEARLTRLQVSLHTLGARVVPSGILWEQPPPTTEPEALGVPVAPSAVADVTVVAPRAIVIWAHTPNVGVATETWRTTVGRLVVALRGLGIDADVDLAQSTEPIDWTRWGPAKVLDSDYVIAVVNAAWSRRFTDTEEAGVGAGSIAEADALLGLLATDRRGFQAKVVPVVLPGASDADVPTQLEQLTRYPVTSCDYDGLGDLVRRLTGQAQFVLPPVGSIPVLPPLDPNAPAPTSPVPPSREALEQRQSFVRAGLMETRDDGLRDVTPQAQAMFEELRRMTTALGEFASGGPIPPKAPEPDIRVDELRADRASTASPPTSSRRRTDGSIWMSRHSPAPSSEGSWTVPGTRDSRTQSPSPWRGPAADVSPVPAHRRSPCPRRTMSMDVVSSGLRTDSREGCSRRSVPRPPRCSETTAPS